MSETGETTYPQLKQIIEAALLASGEPLNHARLAALFELADDPRFCDNSARVCDSINCLF